MVKITQEEVYEAFSNEWRNVYEVYQEIGRKKGVEGLSLLSKLKYLATFQYPYVNRMIFELHISNLRANEALEIRRKSDDVEVMKSEIRRNPNFEEEPSKLAHLIFDPFWFI